MDCIDYFVRFFEASNKDQLTIQLLGIRLFNGAASALQLLAGYYQISGVNQRDLLETAFLIDFLHSNPAQIAVWRGCEEADRNKQFSAVKIRIALDARDGFTEQKREQHYKLLRSLAAHPSFVGFQMLRPVPSGDAHCGPYFEATALDATLSELAKIGCIAVGSLLNHFKDRGPRDRLAGLNWLEVQGAWFKRFFNQPLTETLS
jgi:hypothetical protein